MPQPLVDDIIRVYRLNRAWVRAAITRETYLMAYTYRRSIGGLIPRIDYRQRRTKLNNGTTEMEDLWESPIEDGPIDGLLVGDLPARADGTRPTYKDRPIATVQFRLSQMVTQRRQGAASARKFVLMDRWPLGAPVPNHIVLRSVGEGRDEVDYPELERRGKDWLKRYRLISELARTYRQLREDAVAMLERCYADHAVLADLHARFMPDLPGSSLALGTPYPYGQIYLARTSMVRPTAEPDDVLEVQVEAADDEPPI